jgi:NitT/TauT family transport system ATP-binding protein
MKFSIASKSFGTKSILGPVEVALEGGTITALMGPSGSGKTTLLRIIAGLDHDDRRALQPEYKIGMVFQEPHLLPWKTVLENISLAGPEAGGLHALGLGDVAQLYPRELSLGMARRVAFVRALAGRPELLLLDEPFASLDAQLIGIMQSHLNSFVKETKIPVLMTTHNPRDAQALDAKVLQLVGAPAILHRSASI